jgi:hypothetical protein
MRAIQWATTDGPMDTDSAGKYSLRSRRDAEIFIFGLQITTDFTVQQLPDFDNGASTEKRKSVGESFSIFPRSQP